MSDIAYISEKHNCSTWATLVESGSHPITLHFGDFSDVIF